MKSKYDEIVEKARKDGTLTILTDTDEGMAIIEEMNKISAEVRAESIRKQRASEIAASKVYFNSPPLI